MAYLISIEYLGFDVDQNMDPILKNEAIGGGGAH